MRLGGTSEQYGPVMQSLHWLTVALVIAAYVMAPGGSEQKIYSAASDFSRRTHETIGICVFLLTILRLGWRAGDPAPRLGEVRPWMHAASRTVQAMIYLLLFSVPLTAAAGAWLAGHPLTLWGAGDIAPMLKESRDVGKAIANWHTTLCDALLVLAGLHAAAALYHHGFLKDRVLRSMLPLKPGDG